MTSKWLPFSHLDLRKENILHASGPHQTLLLSKPNLETFSIYSSKFFHNFHLSKSSFICPGLWASVLAPRLHVLSWDTYLTYLFYILQVMCQFFD
jgi:hypothetical protein